MKISKKGMEMIENIDFSENCRMDDACFHDDLEISEDSGDVCISTETQNTSTENWVSVFQFPNEQDYANSCSESKEDFLADCEEEWSEWKAEHILEKDDGTGEYIDDEDIDDEDIDDEDIDDEDIDDEDIDDE